MFRFLEVGLEFGSISFPYIVICILLAISCCFRKNESVMCGKMSFRSC